MRVIISMAISANGMIATKDGNEDFLSHANWEQFIALIKKTGCFIYGRKTYDAVITWGDDYLKDLDNIAKIVISHEPFDPLHGFLQALSVQDALTIAAQKGFNEVIVSGGAGINSAFATLGLIDEVILAINATIVGEGISVFSPSDFMLPMKINEIKQINDEICEIHWHVVK